MKSHLGVEAESGLSFTLVTTAVNTQGVTQVHALLHGDERIVFVNLGYPDVEKLKDN